MGTLRTPGPGALFLLALVCSWALTGLARRAAQRAELLDHPNERSSHKVPTPRGGGIAFALTFFAVPSLVLGLPFWATGPLAWPLLLGGGVVALVGLADDRWSLSPLWRLLVHGLASATALFAFQRAGLHPLPLPGLPPAVGWAIAALWLVWAINLYNFMDGIDGLAAWSAVFAAGTGGLLYLQGGATQLGTLALVLAGGVAGFLAWNRPPARIFMGDGGSGFLGFVLGLYALSGTALPGDRNPLVVGALWLILLTVMVSDATVTLGRRLLRGERVWQAHRSHAYQHLAARWGHAWTTGAVILLDLFLLLPLGLLAWLRPGWAGLIVLAVYAAAAAMALALKAGKADGS